MSGFAMGIDPNRVDDTPRFRLGSRGTKFDGSEWMYLEADSTIAASAAVIIHDDGGADEIGSTNAAAGVGKQVAVAPPSPSQSIVDGKFFWGCVYAPAVAGVKVMAANEATGHVRAIPHGDTTDAGIVAEAADGDPYIHGLVLAADVGSTDAPTLCIVNYPVVATDDDGS